MTKLFFTADTHFGHANIIRHSNRPFASPDEMDAALVSAWNERVSGCDRVYHLGDFCLGSQHAQRYLDQLNGEIHLVLGNHDERKLMERTGRFASITQMIELRHENRKLVLCHYPMRSWPGSFHGSWHLFGHMHGQFDQERHGLSMDVGVDSNSYRPLCFEEIVKIMTALPDLEPVP